MFRRKSKVCFPIYYSLEWTDSSAFFSSVQVSFHCLSRHVSTYTLYSLLHDRFITKRANLCKLCEITLTDCIHNLFINSVLNLLIYSGRRAIKCQSDLFLSCLVERFYLLEKSFSTVVSFYTEYKCTFHLRGKPHKRAIYVIYLSNEWLSFASEHRQDVLTREISIIVKYEVLVLPGWSTRILMEDLETLVFRRSKITRSFIHKPRHIKSSSNQYSFSEACGKLCEYFVFLSG